MFDGTTFSSHTTAPPTSLLLKRAAGIETGAGKAGSQVAGTVTMKHIYEIAKIKMQDVKGVGEEQVSLTLISGQNCFEMT